MFKNMMEQDKKVFQDMISQLEEQLHVKLQTSISEIKPAELPKIDNGPDFKTEQLEL